MTDITELAQREKFEAWAEEVGALPWGILKKHRNQDGSYPGPHYTYMWKAWQAASAELVEALEKAQQTEKTLESRNRRLDGIITAAEKRIAELESRTVKLPKCHSMLLREDFNEDYHTEMAYKADEVHASLAAAGIKVEAE